MQKPGSDRRKVASGNFRYFRMGVKGARVVHFKVGDEAGWHGGHKNSPGFPSSELHDFRLIL